MFQPTRVILHCSDTADDGDRIGVKEIDEWHRARGFAGCGYHFVIRRSGRIESGRPITEIGAHCKGHNEDSIGVCYVGRNIPSDEQILALGDIFQDLRDRLGITFDKWFGHSEFDKGKVCPGIPMSLLRLWFASFQRK